MNRPTTAPGDVRTSREFRLWLWLLAGAVFFLTVQVAAFAPAFNEVDELPHVGYTMSLLSGQLPTIDTPTIDDPAWPALHRRLEPLDQAHSRVWVANHPPLFYALAAPVLGIAKATGHANLGLLGLRALNAAGFAAMVALTGLLARELVPRRQGVALLAAAVAAVFGSFTYLGGAVYNDGLSAALICWLLVLAVRVLRRGPTRRRTLTMAVVGSAAALTRVTGLPLVALCVVASVAAVLLRGRAPADRRRAVLDALLVGGVPALAAGWFYLRNLALYGDLTGTSALLTKFHRVPRPEYLDPANLLSFLRWQWERLFVLPRIRPGIHRWNAWTHWLGLVVALGLAIAVTAALVRRLRAGRPGPMVAAGSAPNPGGRPATDPGGRPATVIAWLLLAVQSLVPLVTMVSFAAQGGGAHERYLVPLAPVVAVLTAIGLLGLLGWLPPRLGWRVEPMAAVVIAAVLLVLSYPIHRALIGWLHALQLAAPSVPGRPPLGGAVLPVVLEVLGVLALTAAIAVALVTAVRAGRVGADPPPESPPVPSGDEADQDPAVSPDLSGAPIGPDDPSPAVRGL